MLSQDTISPTDRLNQQSTQAPPTWNEHKRSTSKSMFSILIVEDELLIAEMLKDFIISFGYHVIDTAPDVDAAVAILKNDTKPDLVIIDINLESQKTGFDLAVLIEQEYHIPFVFLTSYSDTKTIKEAITLKPEAYLIKPIKSVDIFTTIEIIRNKSKWQPKENQSTVIKDGSQIIKLNVNEILWIKSDNVYIEVQLTHKKLLLRKSLDGFIAELNSEYIVRSHRSYAVNLQHLKAISGFNLQLGDDVVPLSRMHKEELVEKFKILQQ